MSIRKVAWAGCVAATLLLGGCVLDTAGGGGNDEPLGTGSWELAAGQEVVVAPGVGDDAVDQPGDDPLPGDGTNDPVVNEAANPTPGQAPPIQPDQVAEPHPDPWMSVNPLKTSH